MTEFLELKYDMCPKKSFRANIGINIVNLSVQKKKIWRNYSTTNKQKRNNLQTQTTLVFKFYIFLNIISYPTRTFFLPVLGYFLTEIKKMAWMLSKLIHLQSEKFIGRYLRNCSKKFILFL